MKKKESFKHLVNVVFVIDISTDCNQLNTPPLNLPGDCGNMAVQDGGLASYLDIKGSFSQKTISIVVNFC